MAEGYFHRLHQETPTRLWINNPTLEEADLAIAAGAISCTTNPSYSARIIKMEPDRAARAIHAAIQESPDDQRAADIAQQTIVKEIMEKFLPLYDRAPGRQGLVSIQGNPHLDEDPAHIVDEAMRFRKISPELHHQDSLHGGGPESIRAVDSPRICPSSPRKSLPWRRPARCANCTSAFPSNAASIPLSTSRTSPAFSMSAWPKRRSAKASRFLREALAQAGCILARRQYAMMRKRGYDITLMGGGARGTHHFTEMVGGALHVTINWSTADEIIKADPPITSRIDAAAPQAIVDELCAKLPDFRKAYAGRRIDHRRVRRFRPSPVFPQYVCERLGHAGGRCSRTPRQGAGHRLNTGGPNPLAEIPVSALTGTAAGNEMPDAL